LLKSVNYQVQGAEKVALVPLEYIHE
jgi:hypothetical protein